MHVCVAETAVGEQVLPPAKKRNKSQGADGMAHTLRPYFKDYLKSSSVVFSLCMYEMQKRRPEERHPGAVAPKR